MPRYQLADLETRVYARLENNSLLYPQAEVDAAINEAIQVFNLVTGCLQKTLSAGDTIARRLIYWVPSGILVPFQVTLAGRPLTRTTVEALAWKHDRWMAHTTANFGPVAHWVPLDLWHFALHPADAAGGKALAVVGMAEPTPLVNPSDAVALPEEFVDALVEMAGYTCQLKEGGKVFSDAAVLYQNFLARAKEWKRWATYKNPRFFIEAATPRGPR